MWHWKLMPIKKWNDYYYYRNYYCSRITTVNNYKHNYSDLNRNSKKIIIRLKFFDSWKWANNKFTAINNQLIRCNEK